MQKKPDESELTIIVPIHNISSRTVNLRMWLRDAIATNIKVILVHDRSEDDTAFEINNIIEEMESPLISLINVGVESPGLSRNQGLALVDTPWFSFADADDFVEINNLVKLLSETKFSRSEIGIGSYRETNLKTKVTRNVVPPKKNLNNLALHLALKMGLWRMIFKTESFRKIVFPSNRMGEDYIYLGYILNFSSKILVSEILVYVYLKEGDFSLTSNRSVMFDMIDILKKRKKLEVNGDLGKKFKIYSEQKLAISILKNVELYRLKGEFKILILTLISHPRMLLSLLLFYVFDGA